jgi:hypothetical protein
MIDGLPNQIPLTAVVTQKAPATIPVASTDWSPGTLRR